MPTVRQRRVNERLLEELSMLVPAQLDDPVLESLRVTRVETTQDLATAKVYVTVADPDASFEEIEPALRRAESHLRGQLSDVGLRRLPRLVFARDKAFEGGERVLSILAELEAEKADTDTDTDADRRADDPAAAQEKPEADADAPADPSVAPEDEPPAHDAGS